VLAEERNDTKREKRFM